MGCVRQIAADRSVILLLCSSQAISISKAINSQEAPVKEKHARRILVPWGLGEVSGARS